MHRNPVLLSALLVVSFLQVAEGRTVSVTASTDYPSGTLIRIPVVERESNMVPRVSRVASGKLIPCGFDGKSVVFATRTPIKQGERHVFELRWLPAPATIPKPSPSGFRIESTPSVIRLDHDNSRWLEYRITSPKRPSTVAEIYERSGYLHPIMTPGGQELTGDFSPKHLHQRGVFNAWVKTIAVGQSTDFWNLGKGTGRTIHSKVKQTSAADGFASFGVEIRHQARAEDRWRDVLSEDWMVTASREQKTRVVEFTTTQTNISGKPFRILKHHYGGFAFRGNDDWDAPASHTDWLTSSGHDRVTGNQQPARWIRFGGRLNDEECWLVVLSSGQNLRSPQPMRLHPAESYFCFNPSSAGELTWKAGDGCHLRYQLRVSSEKPTVAEIEQAWRAFNAPLVATDAK